MDSYICKLPRTGMGGWGILIYVTDSDDEDSDNAIEFFSCQERWSSFNSVVFKFGHVSEYLGGLVTTMVGRLYSHSF